MGLYKKKVEKRNNCQRIKSFRKARNVDKGNADLNAFDKLKYLCVSLFKNEISINSCLNDKINKRSEAIFFSLNYFSSAVSSGATFPRPKNGLAEDSARSENCVRLRSRCES